MAMQTSLLVVAFLALTRAQSWNSNPSYQQNQYGNQYGSQIGGNSPYGQPTDRYNQGGQIGNNYLGAGGGNSLSPFMPVYEWPSLDYAWLDEVTKSQALSNRRFIPENNALSGVKVWRDRVYVTIPRWKEGVPVTVASLPAQSFNPSIPQRLDPFPNWQMQEIGNCSALQSVQAIEIDTEGRIWIVDTGRTNTLNAGPGIGVPSRCPPKLVIIDLNSVQFGQGGFNQGLYPGQSGYNPSQTGYNSGQYPQPGQPGYNPNQAYPQPGQPGYNPSQTYPGQSGYNPSQYPQPGQPGYNPSQTYPQPGQPGYNPNQPYPQPGQPGYNPSQYPQPGQPGYNPSQTYPQPGQPGYNPSQTYPQPGQPGYNPSQTYPQPGQPGYNPSQYPQPGQPGYNPNQYPQPGQPGYNPSQTYPGQYSQSGQQGFNRYGGSYNQYNNTPRYDQFGNPLPQYGFGGFGFNNFRIVKSYTFPTTVATPFGNQLNNIVLDNANGWYAYISDSGDDPGIVVYSFREDRAWKVKDARSMRSDPDVGFLSINNIDVELRNKNVQGLALSPAAGYERTLYFSPLGSYNLYSVPTSVLKNPNANSDISSAVVDLGRKQSITSGMIMDNRGNLYFGLLGLNAIAVWNTNHGRFTDSQRILSRDNRALQWADSFGIDDQGNLWVVTNRLQNYITGRVNPNEPNYRILKAPLGGRSYQNPADMSAGPGVGGGQYGPGIGTGGYDNYGSNYYYGWSSATFSFASRFLLWTGLMASSLAFFLKR